MAGFTVDPHQLLGIEVNPRAAAIAELVLWIGYLQWHFRTRGRVAPPEPIIKAFHNIECRDAVLACDGTAPVLDESGAPVTRWDGRTTKPHPVTGEEVPDETARLPLLSYQNPRPADWPQADFIVGNPPFIGTARMRDALGDGYTEVVRAAYPDVPESADFVMYWWHKAASLARQGAAARFGLITTNSLRQTFNRRVLEHHLGGKPVSVCQSGPNPASGAGLPPGAGQTPQGVAGAYPRGGSAAPAVSATATQGVAGAYPVGGSAAPAVSAAATQGVAGAYPGGGSAAPAVSAAVTQGVAGAYPGGGSAAPAVSAAATQGVAGAYPGGGCVAPAVSAAATQGVAGAYPGGGSMIPAGKRLFAPSALPPLGLCLAIPDHPWVDSADGAAVRIAMTVGAAGQGDGRLAEVVAEVEHGEDATEVTLRERTGLLHANLAIGANVGATVSLEQNRQLAHRGFQLIGAGFIVTREEAAQLGLGRIAGLERHIREYRNGKDLTATPRGVLVIDLFGLTADEVRDRFPEVFQWVVERVKPERDMNNRESYRRNWWTFGEPRREMRPALAGLPRYIATVETSKHRIFQFLDASVLPDNKLITIALDDAFHLGVLSSRIHVAWALAAGSWLGVGNDPVYVKTRCFETFPFPEASEAQRGRIRELAERLDAHRKRQQSLHPKLTLTDCYNVLEKLRAGTALTAKEQTTHEHGLISVLRQLHDELDAAVAETYGLARDAPDDAILTHLCALNAQRAAEEQQGRVRWLRPAFQTRNAEGGVRSAQQPALDMPEASDTPHPALPIPKSKQPWPKPLPERVRAVADALTTTPQTTAQVTTRFKAAKAAEVEEILATLVLMGRAWEEAEGYVVK